MIYSFVKRFLDLIFSITGLLFFSPLFITISILIKCDGGPVFYRGERVGRYGKLFRIFKFRSMIVDAEKTGISSTTDEDPRITKTGLFLRKTKLDELPQLINVLKGEMSFVGPRPEVKKFTDMYTEEEKKLLDIKPGITDWASLWNPDEGALLAGSLDPDKDYMEKIRPEKIRLQLKYAAEKSLITDLKIIFFTLKTIVMK